MTDGLFTYLLRKPRCNKGHLECITVRMKGIKWFGRNSPEHWKYAHGKLTAYCKWNGMGYGYYIVVDFTQTRINCDDSIDDDVATANHIIQSWGNARKSYYITNGDLRRIQFCLMHLRSNVMIYFDHIAKRSDFPALGDVNTFMRVYGRVRITTAMHWILYPLLMKL